MTEYPLEGIAAEVSRAVFPPAAPSVGTETPAETLRRLMSEILIMRPFLIEGFDSEQTVQPLPGGQFFAWNFVTWPFLPVVAVVDTDEARLRLFTGDRGLAPDRSVAFNLHGLPSACGLWLSTVSDLKNHGDETMARFARLLGMVHAQCRDLYAKVDFGPILSALDAHELEKIDADRSIGIALATPMESAGVSAPAASVPAGSEPALQVAAPFPSRSLRLRHLLACLVRCGCQVGPGKGSEIKVWRPGGHIFTLGRHRQDPEINSFIVKRVLHRLQIPVEQFIDAAWSRRLGRHTTVAPLVGLP